MKQKQQESCRGVQIHTASALRSFGLRTTLAGLRFSVIEYIKSHALISHTLSQSRYAAGTAKELDQIIFSVDPNPWEASGRQDEQHECLAEYFEHNSWLGVVYKQQMQLATARSVRAFGRPIAIILRRSSSIWSGVMAKTQNKASRTLEH